MRRAGLVVMGVATVAAVLVYLRDPAWLATARSGILTIEARPDQPAYRRMFPHVWFFVSAGTTEVDVPLLAVFQPDDHRPIHVAFTVDDNAAANATFAQEGSQVVRVPVHGHERGGRRHVRIDLRVDSVWDGGLTGLQLGDIRSFPSTP